MNQIFYLSTNGGTLIICLKNKPTTNVINKSQCTFLYHQEELIGINIFDVDKNIPNLKVGLVYANNLINDFIETQTGINVKMQLHFVVVKVIECTKIVNTHLHKCIIFDGQDNVDVICGAKNVHEDMLTVWAKPNTILPNGQIILSGTIMGHVSHGMLCSDKELGLAQESTGILDLSNHEIGKEFLSVYPNH